MRAIINNSFSIACDCTPIEYHLAPNWQFHAQKFEMPKIVCTWNHLFNCLFVFFSVIFFRALGVICSIFKVSAWLIEKSIITQHDLRRYFYVSISFFMASEKAVNSCLSDLLFRGREFKAERCALSALRWCVICDVITWESCSRS